MKGLLVCHSKSLTRRKRTTSYPIKLVESYINICNHFDSLFAQRGYLIGAIPKGTEISECNKAIPNKEDIQKDGKGEIQKLQERDQLIKNAMSLFELVPDVCPSGPP